MYTTTPAPTRPQRADATPGTPEFRARVAYLRAERVARREQERAAAVAAQRAEFARTC